MKRCFVDQQCRFVASVSWIDVGVPRNGCVVVRRTVCPPMLQLQGARLASGLPHAVATGSASPAIERAPARTLHKAPLSGCQARKAALSPIHGGTAKTEVPGKFLIAGAGIHPAANLRTPELAGSISPPRRPPALRHRLDRQSENDGGHGGVGVGCRKAWGN